MSIAQVNEVLMLLTQEAMAAMAATDMETDATLPEHYRAQVLEGDIGAAMALCRRLFQSDVHWQRMEAAHLVLDRLRAAPPSDTRDDVNALLRLLCHSVAPTRELTEDALSLLFVSEHRVLVIHALAKLTYQSRECVRLVVNAYSELLSSDRALLVPILGSLADLPLEAADKETIIETTECLLDAAAEEDMPAVVQSLLAMMAPSCAARIAAEIRLQCNRMTTSTLSLIFEVILRHAVTGSCVLPAFLRLVRHATPQTVFDVIFIAILIGKPTENRAGVWAAKHIAASGRIHPVLMVETCQRLSSAAWKQAFPTLVRYCSALLETCFDTRVKATTAGAIASAAMDMLGLLISQRTIAQEESLSLLLAIVSQPNRLLPATTRPTASRATINKCWEIVHIAAEQLRKLATDHPRSIAPFSHLFLDQLHSIASAVHDQDDVGGIYPPSTMDSLCRTMVLLAKQEPGILPLVLITIQKQLVTPAGIISDGFQSSFSGQSVTTHQLKQLMAVSLAGHLLNEGVGDQRDRDSAFNWIVKLMSAPTSDSTLMQLIRLLRGQIVGSLAPADKAKCAVLFASVFKKKGFMCEGVADTARDGEQSCVVIPGLFDQKAAKSATSIVINTEEYVRQGRLGVPPFSWAMDMREHVVATVLESYFGKVKLLRELFRGYLAICSNEDAQRMLECGFLVASSAPTEVQWDMMSWATTAWSLVCAYHIAITSINILAAKKAEQENTAARPDIARSRKQLMARLQTCWIILQRLMRLIAHGAERIKLEIEVCEDDRELSKLRWFQQQQNLLTSCLRLNGDAQHSSSNAVPLAGLHITTVCSILEGLWKLSANSVSATIEMDLEVELLKVLAHHLSPGPEISAQTEERTATLTSLFATRYGRRSFKYLLRRLGEWIGQVNVCHDSIQAEDAEEEAPETGSSSLVAGILNNGVFAICAAVQGLFEWGRDSHADRHDTDRFLELLARGVGCLGADDENAYPSAVHCQVVFEFFRNAAVQVKNPRLMCELTNVLMNITLHMNKQVEVSRLCLALLHQPIVSSAGQATDDGCVLPLRGLAEGLVTPSGSGQVALTKYRMPSPPVCHAIFLAVGSWASAPFSTLAISNLLYLVDSIHVLIESTRPPPDDHADQEEKMDATSNSSDDVEVDPSRLLASDGEHRVLKNLTNSSLPWLLEIVFMCAAVTPLRCTPHASLSSPYLACCCSLGLIEQCLFAFLSAEACGYNLPTRISVSILRGGPLLRRTVHSLLERCIAWRLTQSEQTDAGALHHFGTLLLAAQGLTKTMDALCVSFQDRIVLKMQSNMHVTHEKNATDRRRWRNELLRKAYGKVLQRRKPISKQEAKLLPFFAHAVGELRTEIAEYCQIYRIDQPDDPDDHVSAMLDSIRLEGTQLEHVLEMLNTFPQIDLATYNEESLKLEWSQVHEEDQDDDGDEEDEESTVEDVQMEDVEVSTEDGHGNGGDKEGDAATAPPQQEVVHTTLVARSKRTKRVKRA